MLKQGYYKPVITRLTHHIILFGYMSIRKSSERKMIDTLEPFSSSSSSSSFSSFSSVLISHDFCSCWNRRSSKETISLLREPSLDATNTDTSLFSRLQAYFHRDWMFIDGGSLVSPTRRFLIANFPRYSSSCCSVSPPFLLHYLLPFITSLPPLPPGVRDFSSRGRDAIRSFEFTSYRFYFYLSGPD